MVIIMIILENEAMALKHVVQVDWTTSKLYDQVFTALVTMTVPWLNGMN